MKARESVLELDEETFRQHREHATKYDKTRQPLLTGLASQYDLKLFQDAQARACEQRVGIADFDVLVAFCTM